MCIIVSSRDELVHFQPVLVEVSQQKASLIVVVLVGVRNKVTCYWARIATICTGEE